MLKVLYVAYFSAVGVAVPFFPPYLFDLGLSAREVSLVLSAAPLLHLGVPLVWGWVADRWQRPDWLLRAACVGAALALVPILGVRSMPWLFGVYLVHQFFAVSILGLTDSLALARADKEAYARTRLWGSLSFLVACLGCGLWLAEGKNPAGALVPGLMLSGYVVLAVCSFGVRGQARTGRPRLHQIAALVKNPRFLQLLAITPFHWATLATYHGYLGKLILDRGFAESVVGYAFVVAVVAEIAAFYAFAVLARRFSVPALLAAATLVTSARWALVAVAPGAVSLVAIQLLHAFSFGLFWAGAMAWMAEVVPPNLRATGQAIYTGVTFGLGNLAGLSAAGWLYDRTGGAAAAFSAAAALELIPFALALAARRSSRRTQTSPG